MRLFVIAVYPAWESLTNCRLSILCATWHVSSLSRCVAACDCRCHVFIRHVRTHCVPSHWKGQRDCKAGGSYNSFSLWVSFILYLIGNCLSVVFAWVVGEWNFTAMMNFCLCVSKISFGGSGVFPYKTSQLLGSVHLWCFYGFHWSCGFSLDITFGQASVTKVRPSTHKPLLKTWRG